MAITLEPKTLFGDYETRNVKSKKLQMSGQGYDYWDLFPHEAKNCIIYPKQEGCKSAGQMV